MMTRLAVYAIAGTLISALAVGFWWHYTGILRENASLRLTIESYSAELERRNDERKRFQAQLEALNAERIAANKARAELAKLFSEHDLGRLLEQKPGLLERAINRGTADALRMLECSSGNTESCPEDSPARARTPGTATR